MNLASASPSADGLVRVSALRQELAHIRSAQDARYQMDRAAYWRDVFKVVGKSLEECNELAEIYLVATWKFGDLVQGPYNQEGCIDPTLPGTKYQRNYARRFRAAVEESEIPEYVREATTGLEQASIAGCLGWLHPGRHGYNTGEYEWYTPANIIEAARMVMGGIDLDPASCAEANETVQAATYFAEDDDGLVQTWQGRVFLNPPFAHPTVKYFAEKLLDSLESGSVPQAVWLSNASVDVEWWHRLASKGITCFHRGRIRFYGPHDKGQSSPPLGQTIIYVGRETDRFIHHFERFGSCLVRATRQE